MTDQQRHSETSPQTRAGGPAAAAARRARRIGGRPAGAPSPTSENAPAAVAATRRAGTGPGAVSLAKEDGPAVGLPRDMILVEPSDDADTAPAGDDGTPPLVQTVVPAWLNWLPAGVLTAGALVMAVLLVVISHGVWWGPNPAAVPAAKAPDVVREQVLAAAKTCVAQTNTYTYTDLNGYEAKALRCATGQFAGQLKQTIDTLIKVNAPKLKSSQTAQINQGGIEAITPDGQQWTILLFGQLSVTNNSNPKPRTDPFAAEVRMQHVRGNWLISGLTTVSSPLS